MLYFLLSLIPLVYLIYSKSKKSMHMLQQNYYDESNRYLLWIKNNLFKVFVSADIMLFLSNSINSGLVILSPRQPFQ